MSTPLLTNLNDVNGQPRLRHAKFKRFLDRSNHFHQSRGTFNINRTGGDGSHHMSDIVHTLLHKDTKFLVFALFVTYCASYCAFAPFYWMISSPCGLDINTFGDAFVLSLMAQTTIGFGIPNDYMKGCPHGAILLTMQSVLASMLDAIIIGGFWLRVSRPHNRSQSVLFSDKAVIQEIRGSFYLMFQICELRKHQLVEAKVRCYSMRHSPTFSSRTMRLERPDDELGSLLLLAVPSVVVHRIDPWSPLMPPPQLPLDSTTGKTNTAATFAGDKSSRNDGVSLDGNNEGNNIPLSQPVHARSLSQRQRGRKSQRLHDASVEYLFPDIPQRQSDIENGNREAKSSSTANSSDHDDSSSNHKASNASIKDNVKLAEEIKTWIGSTGSEVVVLVEGEENMTGCSLQARHSYTIDDIEFDHTFATCVVSDKDGGCTIDYSMFHNLVPLSSYQGYVNQDDASSGDLQQGGESMHQNLLMRCSSLSDFYSEA